jgi:hypothetical protein
MFRFPAAYPIESPAVQFVVDQTHQSPIHPVRNFSPGYDSNTGDSYSLRWIDWFSMYILTAMYVGLMCVFLRESYN